MPTLPGFRSVATALLMLAFAGAAPANESLYRQQLLYVPVYSEVPQGDRGFTINLAATLSIRNTDQKTGISVRRIDYYGADGRLVHSYIKQPEVLGPLASSEKIVKESDRSGGISSSFLVEWESPTPVSAPVVEAVMVHGSLNRGLAFTSSARVLESRQ